MIEVGFTAENDGFFHKHSESPLKQYVKLPKGRRDVKTQTFTSVCAFAVNVFEVPFILCVFSSCFLTLRGIVVLLHFVQPPIMKVCDLCCSDCAYFF